MVESSGPNLTLEAIKLLKDRNSGLIVLETAIIGFIGTQLENTNEPVANGLALVAILLFLLSILSSVNLLGSLATLVDKAAEGIVPSAIYDQQTVARGKVKYHAYFSGLCFVVGIVLLAAFLIVAHIGMKTIEDWACKLISC